MVPVGLSSRDPAGGPGEQVTADLAETVERLKRAEVKLVGAGEADRLTIPVLR